MKWCRRNTEWVQEERRESRMRDTISEGVTIGLRRDLELGRSQRPTRMTRADNPGNGGEDNLIALPLK